MIDFSKTWLPQMLGYCQLVLDDARLRKAWIERDTTVSSVVDFDELFEQIFDDLDSETFERNLSVLLAGNEHLRLALGRFLSNLRELDLQRTQRSELRDPSVLLASPEWRNLRDAAASVLAAS